MKTVKELENLLDGLTYRSETDAPFAVLTEADLQDIDFDCFFAQLTAKQDWHEQRVSETVERFEKLRNYIVKNLTNVRISKFGAVEKLIIIAGRDRDGKEIYITTRAVER
jgi:hypothetical protein